MIALGALLGCLIAGPAVDLLGRKVAIIAGAIPLELGWLLLFFAMNRLMLYAGRVITGVGCGIETLAVAVSSNDQSRLRAVVFFSLRSDGKIMQIRKVEAPSRAAEQTPRSRRSVRRFEVFDSLS